MMDHQDGQDATDQPNELQQALRIWEVTIRTFETNFYRLQLALDTPSPYQAELIELRNKSILYLETLYLEIDTESIPSTAEELLRTLCAHIALIQEHNQQVSRLLDRLS